MPLTPPSRRRRPAPRKVVDPENPPVHTVDSLIYEYPVVLFSISNNVFCLAAKQMLNDLGARYLAIDLDKLEEDDFAAYDDSSLANGPLGNLSFIISSASNAVGRLSALDTLATASGTAAITPSINIATTMDSGDVRGQTVAMTAASAAVGAASAAAAAAAAAALASSFNEDLNMVTFACSFADPTASAHLRQTPYHHRSDFFPQQLQQQLQGEGFGYLDQDNSQEVGREARDELDARTGSNNCPFLFSTSPAGLSLGASATPSANYDEEDDGGPESPDPALRSHLQSATCFLAENPEYNFRSSTAARLWHELGYLTAQYFLPSLFIDECHIGGAAGMHRLGMDKLEDLLRNAGAIEDAGVDAKTET